MKVSEIWGKIFYYFPKIWGIILGMVVGLLIAIGLQKPTQEQADNARKRAEDDEKKRLDGLSSDTLNTYLDPTTRSAIDRIKQKTADKIKSDLLNGGQGR